jgi:alpha-beta hydrolase superfamily lysophospholipase
MRRLGLVLCLALAAAPSILRAQTHTVFLRAADGTSLAATLYQPAQRPASAIVLLHMLTRSRRDWDVTAERLRQAGFVVLVPDLRGHGDSSGSSGSVGDLTTLVQDAQAAVSYVKAYPGVRPEGIGLAGASLGASLAALVAGADPSVDSLALLSPSLDYRGLRCEPAMRKYSPRPALLVAAVNDPYAARTVKQLASGGSNRQVLMIEAAGHGTVLLSRHPPLVDHLVDWFRRTLL